MVPTVDGEKRPLFGAKNTRPTTIEMTYSPAAVDDGVLWRDRLRALRARRALPFHHEAPPMQMGDESADATGAGRQLASTRCPVVGGRRIAPSSLLTQWPAIRSRTYAPALTVLPFASPLSMSGRWTQGGVSPNGVWLLTPGRDVPRPGKPHDTGWRGVPCR